MEEEIDQIEQDTAIDEQEDQSKVCGYMGRGVHGSGSLGVRGLQGDARVTGSSSSAS
jgi:hypothetical protein